MSDLNYRTFSSLMAAVKKPLHLFDNNNLIKDANYIRIARAINSELGIKVNQQKEVELEVENSRAFLPEDCLSIVGAVAITTRDHCIIDDHNFNLDLYKKLQTYYYYPLTPTRRAINKFSKTSYNRRFKGKYQIDVDEDELTFNFEKGVVIIAYVSDMVDERGNLLVLDHPIINEYYESAIRVEVLKDLWYNMDADTQIKYQNERDAVLPPLRKRASLIVNFPGYKKLREYTLENERRFYSKYYKNIV